MNPAGHPPEIKHHVASRDRLFPVPSHSESPQRALIWFLVTALLSVLLYVAIFSQVRLPYSVGIYQQMIGQKAAHFTSSPAPRLLIIAGSNARVSHRAELMERELGIPTTNGGLSADVSIMLALDSFERHLRRGDAVYLPLEYESLVATDRGSKRDYLYMVAYDRKLLGQLPVGEWVRAWFSFDLSHLFASAAEVAITRSIKANSTRGETNAHGDQVGYTDEAALKLRPMILSLEPKALPSYKLLREHPPAVRSLSDFLYRCRERGILVIGGLPTIFDDIELDPLLVGEIKKIYENSGQKFISLPNSSQYPRSDFYDSRYHLSDSAAVRHSKLVADALKPLIEHAER